MTDSGQDVLSLIVGAPLESRTRHAGLHPFRTALATAAACGFSAAPDPNAAPQILKI
jgi:hypothetical protein